MDDALLDLCLWVYRLNRLGESGQTVHTCDQDIFYTAVTQTIQDRQPKLCTFILALIHSQNLIFSIHVDTYSYIDRTFYDPSFMTDVIMYGIHEDHRIDLLQRAFLPVFYDGKDLVCDTADGACQKYQYRTDLSYGFLCHRWSLPSHTWK